MPLGTHPVYGVRSRANHLPITGGNLKPIQLLVVSVLGPRADAGPANRPWSIVGMKEIPNSSGSLALPVHESSMPSPGRLLLGARVRGVPRRLQPSHGDRPAGFAGLYGLGRAYEGLGRHDEADAGRVDDARRVLEERRTPGTGCCSTSSGRSPSRQWKRHISESDVALVRGATLQRQQTGRPSICHRHW